MSSDEGGSQQRQASAKKRRLQGACDMCKRWAIFSTFSTLSFAYDQTRISRKKIKCMRLVLCSEEPSSDIEPTDLGDSAKMPGSKCSPCLSFNLQCTHNDPVKKRGPKSIYVAYLESRIKTLEDELDQFKGQGSSESPRPRHVKGHPSPEDAGSPPPKLRSSPSDFHIPSEASPSSSHTPGISDEEDLEYLDLLNHTKNLSLNVMENRFFGHSSSFAYTKNAYRVKKEVTGADLEDTHVKRSKFWAPQLWERPPAWPDYRFPDRDLMTSLVNLYFSKVNPFLPILHAPIFESSVRQNLHLRDEHFAATLLLVCALGSRFSDDPRVLTASEQYLSSGWKWYDQVQTFRRSSFDPSSLYELQYHCLATLYVHGASSITAAWTSVGLGIRYAVELGAHRRKPEGHKLTVEDELKRRAFWVLVILDRSISSFLGRPGSLREEDFDAEMPVECDDEFWDQNAFPYLVSNQPLDKPSKISAFVCLIRLYSISAFAMRTIYSIKKSRLISGVFGDQWERRVINELDASMRHWQLSLPQHLKWTLDRKPDGVFYSQSAYIHVLFHDTQIQIHKPFCDKPGLSPLPSSAICTESARLCIEIVDRHLRYELLGMPDVICTTYGASVTLTMDIWRSKRDGVKLESTDMIDDIRKGLDFLEACEERWSLAGRFRDFVGDLANGLDVLPGETGISAPMDVNAQDFVIREPWSQYALQTDIRSPVQVGYYPPAGEPVHVIQQRPQHQRLNNQFQPRHHTQQQPHPNESRYGFHRKNVSGSSSTTSPDHDRGLRTPYTSPPSGTQELGNVNVNTYPSPSGYPSGVEAQNGMELGYGGRNQDEGGYVQQAGMYGVAPAAAATRGEEQQQQQHQQSRYISGHDVGMVNVNVPGMHQQQQQQMNVGGWPTQNQENQGVYQGYNFNDLGQYVESMAYLNGFMVRQPDMNYQRM
ncbi:hypothetical protein E1B28_000289 [Marasmius oreades]|uniref:Xylanolytic transcriptional activator regulatory domain-containing protein n=1 Tax=Marasmius oreades TaxID=181124 RepID=A0A9P7V129_9AGAR|nr:uncharacterized protein E1B28_000289 [Marasmius oreades]KAG7098328.1 hypothetical protein E1B28_000289 [Marasmius oreades]